MSNAKKKSATPSAAKSASRPSTTTTPLVAKQPQSKQQAAVANKMFLHTDDSWAQAYFTKGDLHCTERELFG